MKTFKEFLSETNETNQSHKVGDIIDFHDDLKRMVSGRIVKITGTTATIERNGSKFKRQLSQVFS